MEDAFLVFEPWIGFEMEAHGRNMKQRFYERKMRDSSDVGEVITGWFGLALVCPDM